MTEELKKVVIEIEFLNDYMLVKALGLLTADIYNFKDTLCESGMILEINEEHLSYKVTFPILGADNE